MSPATTFTGSLVPAAHIVIDCSALCALPANHPEVERVVQWVKREPRKSAIHAFVPSSVRRGDGMKLRATLQSLGCTISMRCAVARG